MYSTLNTQNNYKQRRSTSFKTWWEEEMLWNWQMCAVKSYEQLSFCFVSIFKLFFGKSEMYGWNFCSQTEWGLIQIEIVSSFVFFVFSFFFVSFVNVRYRFQTSKVNFLQRILSKVKSPSFCFFLSSILPLIQPITRAVINFEFFSVRFILCIETPHHITSHRNVLHSPEDLN